MSNIPYKLMLSQLLRRLLQTALERIGDVIEDFLLGPRRMSQLDATIVEESDGRVFLFLHFEQQGQVQVGQFFKASFYKIIDLVWILHLVLHANVPFHGEGYKSGEKFAQCNRQPLVVHEYSQIERVLNVQIHGVPHSLTVADERQYGFLKTTSKTKVLPLCKVSDRVSFTDYAVLDPALIIHRSHSFERVERD